MARCNCSPICPVCLTGPCDCTCTEADKAAFRAAATRPPPEPAAQKNDAVSDAIKLLRDLQSNIGPLRPDPDEEDERETWDKIDRVVERLAARPRAVPDGWKLVPVDPTPAMDAAGQDAAEAWLTAAVATGEAADGKSPAAWTYKAMLAAAAQPTQSADDGTYEAIGKAFREALSDPAVAWRNTRAKEFIARVGILAAALQEKKT